MRDDLLLFDGPADRRLTVILAHGAGAPMDSDFMRSVAQGLADASLRVVRFEFPYMGSIRRDGKKRPPDREPTLRTSWREVLDYIGDADRIVIGGKSLGGRIASLVADEFQVAGLVCLGYPFHPPGNAERTRTAHLKTLRTKALIVQGTRDPFGRPHEVDGYGLSSAVRVHWIEDGDHSLVPRKSGGRTLAQNIGEAVTAVVGFVDRLP